MIGLPLVSSLKKPTLFLLGSSGKPKWLGVVGTDYTKVEQAALLRPDQQLFVKVVGKELENQRVCVCV